MSALDSKSYILLTQQIIYHYPSDISGDNTITESLYFLRYDGNEAELRKLAQLIDYADYTDFWESFTPRSMAWHKLDCDLVFTENEVQKLCSTCITTLDGRGNLFETVEGKFVFPFREENIYMKTGNEAALYLDKILHKESAIYCYNK